VSYGVSDTSFQSGVMNGLVHTLASEHIPAVGFVNEQKLYGSAGLLPFQVSLLERWIDSGMELGNHTYSHPSINNISCREFFSDVIRGETVTKELLKKQGKPLRYFRHPFLNVGNTKEKADSLSTMLAERGYTVAPVTVDNDDYLFAVVYHRALVKKDTSFAARIGRDYIAYMHNKLQYYEREAVTLFGRPIAQILLMHASRLNADHLEALVAMIRTSGYQFVDLATALKDEAYRTPVTVYRNFGITWLDRWALSQGKPGSFFKDEPDVPAYIREGAK
jgi:peptidoglycan/xylan/chitin deacetylase (PgdA/CDA1 family)